MSASERGLKWGGGGHRISFIHTLSLSVCLFLSRTSLYGVASSCDVYSYGIYFFGFLMSSLFSSYHLGLLHLNGCSSVEREGWGKKGGNWVWT